MALAVDLAGGVVRRAHHAAPAAMTAAAAIAGQSQLTRFDGLAAAAPATVDNFPESDSSLESTSAACRSAIVSMRRSADLRRQRPSGARPRAASRQPRAQGAVPDSPPPRARRPSCSAKRPRAREHLVEDHAEREDVGPRIHRQALRLLRRHAGHGSDESPPAPSSPSR